MSEEQRKKLAQTYAEFNRVLTAVDNNAEAVVETINSLGEFIKKLKSDVDNYVGGKADAKKMKVNFKAAEKYAKDLLKDPNISDSTKAELLAAYNEAVGTKDFFCSGKECVEARQEQKKGGPFFFMDDYFETPLCRENKEKLLKLNEKTQKAKEEAEKKKCKPFDGIAIWGQVEITKNTVTDRGSVKSKIGNAIEYKDCTLLPNYCENDKLVGYTVSLNDKDGRFNRIILQVGENQVETFKKGYNNLVGAAMVYYMNGEPSDGKKKMAAVLETGKWSMLWDGLKDEWKDCIRDPVCVATMILSTANGAVSVFKTSAPILEKTLIAELKASGTKFSETELKMISREFDGKILFLENGNTNAGLQHIFERHWNPKELMKYFKNKDEMIEKMFSALKNDKYLTKEVVTKNGREGLEYTYKLAVTGGDKTFKFGVGSNGFIVTFFPQ